MEKIKLKSKITEKKYLLNHLFFISKNKKNINVDTNIEIGKTIPISLFM